MAISHSAESAAAAATAGLAQFVSETNYQDLPAEVIERAKLITADTLGVALRGSQEPEMQELYSRIPAGRGSTLFRSGFPETDPSWAAFANATATCFLELDEGSRPTGHPAMHVLPSTLALSQSQATSGADYLAAMVLGYEVQARVAWASRLRWSVHPHGNMGHVGAIAALGKLSHWSAERIRHGMNSAAALAVASSWQPCIVGATVRNAYPGVTAQTAFTVKVLVESSFTGYDGALGETFGEILGESFDPGALIEGLGHRYAVLDNYFKFHAACALTHPVLDALADALKVALQVGQYPPLPAVSRPEPETIRRVRVWVPERFVRLDVLAHPNQLSAKFSIPYATAAYLVLGSSEPSSFQGPALTDGWVREIEKRVEVVGSREYSGRWPAEAAARVEIELADGQVIEGDSSNPYGSSANPPSVEDLQAKFQYLTLEALPREEQEAVWDGCMRLEELESMSRFPL